MAKCTFVFILSLLIFSNFLAAAEPIDIIKLNSGHNASDQRHLYNWEVIDAALEASKIKYGRSKVKITGSAIPNHQRLKSLVQGRFLNVAMSLTNQEWEDSVIPIRIPIRRGIFSYRLLMINKDKKETFKRISTVNRLKEMRVGVRKSWTTRIILKHLNFNTVDAFSYDAVFAMLDKGRFDYIPRGINEIYYELKVREKDLPNIMIEPDIALYIPSPYYIFVSPKTPRIAERLEYGLDKMVKNGKLNEIFTKHYGKYIERAQIHKKRIIQIGNPLLPIETPLHDSDLWFDFNVDTNTVSNSGSKPENKS
ncbi:transporter substrate-binding domain-containing protein [Psychrosphaera sp. B3R10]|uniref:substrate-binding periplasmic protein n=1 Tax=unclassified Psychrosphaera TaxID=2641570 RepID=UPI001C0849B2|nr:MULTISPECIES: transporter substrate-binding domain-containing protein [unclassified Psychrosphaera]MBU2881050.1 transporter substrate-binding domain-containing protein [Psychrosphaera sp. I2R16]MBU2989974.1 transporter substrate-binding domain-containing protein [Psychrosphaera sp. B3R10]MDO6719134.1 transporter substrate-binding domain-containing protein [Psychrosphaera sp. 1_MG-2023]